MPTSQCVAPTQVEKKYRIMSLSLEGLRRLMRGSVGLPDNMSETDIRHYSAEILRRLQRGEDIGTLEIYLRGIDTSINRRLHVSGGTHDLAHRAHVLFNTTANGPLR
jgi:hypothetical protein